MLPPQSITPEYAALKSGSLWLFGDPSLGFSVMRIERDDAVITVYYERPRPGLLEVGVKPDMLFLKAKIKSDGNFEGQAYRFSKSCPNPRYPMTGKVESNAGIIRMSGHVSFVNEKCEVLFDEKTTNFEFRLLDDASAAGSKKAG
jgi:hypothetical protein